jgi:hypothetical protein
MTSIPQRQGDRDGGYTGSPQTALSSPATPSHVRTSQGIRKLGCVQDLQGSDVASRGVLAAEACQRFDMMKLLEAVASWPTLLLVVGAPSRHSDSAISTAHQPR